MLETSLPIRGWSNELIAILFKVVLLFVRIGLSQPKSRGANCRARDNIHSIQCVLNLGRNRLEAAWHFALMPQPRFDHHPAKPGSSLNRSFARGQFPTSSGRERRVASSIWRDSEKRLGCRLVDAAVVVVPNNIKTGRASQINRTIRPQRLRQQNRFQRRAIDE
jgi:hypothetical protein